jgi:hypothetical protein
MLEAKLCSHKQVQHDEYAVPKVTVDGEEIEVPAGASVIRACELAGKENNHV